MLVFDFLSQKADLGARLPVIVEAVDGLAIKGLTDGLDVMLETLVREHGQHGESFSHTTHCAHGRRAKARSRRAEAASSAHGRRSKPAHGCTCAGDHAAELAQPFGPAGKLTDLAKGRLPLRRRPRSGRQLGRIRLFVGNIDATASGAVGQPTVGEMAAPPGYAATPRLTRSR